MGSSKKIMNGIVWTTLYNVVNAIYGFISVPILIEHFGKDQYGLIGLALSINVYMQLMDLGFNSTNIRFFSVWFSSGQSEKLKRAFQSSLAFYGIIGFLNALILGIVTIFSGEIFDVTPEQNVILRCLLLILMVSAVVNWYSSCFDQLIKATENVGWIQKRSLIPKLIQIVLLFWVIWGNISITVYFAITSFAFFVIIPISVDKIRKEVKPISFLPKWDTQILKEILPYCLGIFSFSIFQFSFYNLRPVFLGIESSVESVADYRILNGIIGVVSLFGSMFLNVLLPTTSKIVAQGNRKSFDMVAYDGTKYITIIVSFCCFGVMSVGPELITIYVGEFYLDLIPWLNLWLLCALATHNQSISSLILAGSKVKAIAINSAISSVLGLIVAWVLIPYFGIGGVIISFVVYLVIQLAFYYFYYWPIKMHINSWRVFYYSFMPATAIGMISYMLIRAIPFHWTEIGNFFMYGMSFVMLYTLLTFLLINKNDYKFLKNIIKKA